MRVMVIAKATATSEEGVLPTPEAFAAMDRYTDELVAAGILVAGAGLKPSREGKRLAYDGQRYLVTDGPFTETRELIAGFSIWEVRDMDEAVAWAQRCPPGSCTGVLELRPFLEVKDLADLPSPEERETPRDGERGRLGVA
ncbi:YciI family protein [Pseudoxanthomonas sp. 10H]|uniref:YciI family protein n=1 Tax=Pseudoxanthomonas sp. 10H TaxID=3242729 RepID=UPI003558112A